MSDTEHHIVIVGGGASGLALASRLGRSYRNNDSIKITLVDQMLTHIWKPLLHEVAAGSFDSSVNEVSFLAQAKRCGFHYRLGTLKSINRADKSIKLEPLSDSAGSEFPARDIPYTTLVLAVGSISNDFNIPGVAEHCLYLDTTQQAENFHKHLITACSRIFIPSAEQSFELHITVIGAGATGVELSAQLHEVIELLNSYIDKKIDLKITLVEGADRILPGLPEYLSSATHAQLESLHINVLTNEFVERVGTDEIHMKSGKIVNSDIHVWAAGISATAILQQSDGLELNKLNQVVVKDTLQSVTDEDIFAMGDCAACKWTADKNVPPRAQSANQQAKLLSKNLVARLNGQPLKPFTYRDYGSLVSLGGYTTVGNLMGNTLSSIRIEGFIARMVYLSLYKMHQVSLFGAWRTGLMTVSNLFRRSVHPVIKMH